MAFSGVSGSMEEDFFTKRQSWKTVRQNRNQVAAHAQKRVTVPLSSQQPPGSIIWNEQRTKDGLFITCICHITAARSRDFSRAWHLRNNMPCMCGIIYERKITICRSLFRSERCFLVQYIRGEILAWIVFVYYVISRAYFRQTLTASIRFSARGFGCLWKFQNEIKMRL